MKNRKVRRASFHIGVNINFSVRSHVDSVKHTDIKEMQFHPTGILIIDACDIEIFVPHSNCHSIVLEPQTTQEKASS